jgi:hypothetical protein
MRVAPLSITKLELRVRAPEIRDSSLTVGPKPIQPSDRRLTPPTGKRRKETPAGANRSEPVPETRPPSLQRLAREWSGC